MRRVLFVTIVLVMLLGSFSSAFAAEPQRVEQVTPALLGEVWWFYFDFGAPGIRVDAYMYRPSTLLGWPFAGGPDYGTWWWTGPDSEMRRQSWPTYQYTDMWGWYYAEFMFPRDEVWFPCSFPLKWKCNYLIDPGSPVDPPVYEYHSPYAMAYECVLDGAVLICLDWPWAVAPYDTVSPMEVYLIDEYGFGYVIPFEILGMYWKFSDIP
jgi:hypothetical protein